VWQVARNPLCWPRRWLSSQCSGRRHVRVLSALRRTLTTRVAPDKSPHSAPRGQRVRTAPPVAASCNATADAPGRSPRAGRGASLRQPAGPHEACVASTDAGPPHDMPAARRPRKVPARDPPRAAVARRSEGFLLRQLLEHRLSNSGSVSNFLSRVFSISSSRNRRASFTFMPPYCARQRFQLDSETSRYRSTSVGSLPSFNSRSPSRNLRTICSGVCRFRFMVMSAGPPCWTSDSHERWTTIRGSRQRRAHRSAGRGTADKTRTSQPLSVVGAA
jgi:hypothetical protein